MRKSYSGKFTPNNPSKYKGDVNNIVFRSSWEYRFLKWLDSNKFILEYSSEETIIPYMSPVDCKLHRYFVDFWIKRINSDNIVVESIVEIKPYAQTIMPKARKKMTPQYLYECKTYAVNQAKWEAAKSWAKKRNMEFLVLTEKELFNK